MRAFKNKWFHRWARNEGITDTALLNTAAEIAEGRAEADLGGYLFKTRLRRLGGGKSGGYRIIVGYKRYDASRIILTLCFRQEREGKHYHEGRSGFKSRRGSIPFCDARANRKADSRRIRMGDQAR